MNDVEEPFKLQLISDYLDFPKHKVNVIALCCFMLVFKFTWFKFIADDCQ